MLMYASVFGGVCTRRSRKRQEIRVFGEQVRVCGILWSGELLEVPTST